MNPPTASPVQSPLADDVCFVRRPGLILTSGSPHYVLRAQHGAVQVQLNPMAVLIWYLCNGQHSVADINTYFQELYPAQHETIARDISQTLIGFQSHGVVEAFAKTAPRPFVRVGFAHFQSGFESCDNYFVWMLTHQFDVQVVDALEEEVDLLFYSTAATSFLDPAQLNRLQAFKIFVAYDHDPPNLTTCDYAISPHPVSPEWAHRHAQLPPWILYLNWDRYQRAAEGVGADRILESYHPQQVCRHLREAYLGAKLNEGGYPSASSTLSSPDPKTTPCVIEHPSLQTGRRQLTIGMATYDDYDGVYFTVQAIRLYHPEVTADTEILVIDNHPDGPCAQPLQELAHAVEGYRYIPYGERRGTAVRDLIFREARTPYVMSIDSHVLFHPGALKQLLNYFKANRDCPDLLQGPMVGDSLIDYATHFEPEWSAGMYGVWGTDDQGKDPGGAPFEIPMQGLGVFACRQAVWPGFNPRFRGFGAEEGYLHEKFRQAGHRTLCLPFLRWGHRFQRPFGAKYQNQWEDRIWNYLVGWTELGLDISSLETHFRQVLGEPVFARIYQECQRELANPFSYFDAIYCINLDRANDRWQEMQQRFERLGITRQVRRLSAIETPESHHIGCALSHRQVLEQARKHQFNHVLVLEDDAVFHRDIFSHLERSVRELDTQDWKLFHLGGYRWGNVFPKAPGCRFLNAPCDELTCTHAVAYHHSVYQELLDALPGDIEGMKKWLDAHYGIDQYLQRVDRRYLADPIVASQPPLLGQADTDKREDFS